MLSRIFLGMSLVGAEWVLYLLILLSVISVTVIIERVRFYREATKGLIDWRNEIRSAASQNQWDHALKAAQFRAHSQTSKSRDLEAELAYFLLHHSKSGAQPGTDVMTEVAQDAVVRARIQWEKNLAVLATIGSNAPFVGLFGTVLGIIKAFHDLSQQAAVGGASTVTAGISEALIATAVGILVAIPAVVAFNLFQRRVKAALAEAEALKSFLIGKLAK